MRARKIITGVTPDTLTLRRLFDSYTDRKLPLLTPKMQRWAATTRDLFLRCWGGDELVMNVDQTHVDQYERDRTSGALTPDEGGRLLRGKRPPEGKGRKPRPVKPGTVASDLRWLSSCFNWARGLRLEGRALLVSNPLDTVERPADQNIRRPRASVERYTATLPHCDTVARWAGCGSY